MKLIERDGLDNVTTGSIANEAGVSPRTFFNYFPHKEAALLPEPPAITDCIRARFAAGRRTLLEDLGDALADAVEAIGYDRDVLLRMHEIAMTDSRIMAQFQVIFRGFEADLIDLIQLRVCKSDPDRAELLAGLVILSLRFGFKSWVLSTSGNLSQSVRNALADTIRTAQEITAEASLLAVRTS